MEGAEDVIGSPAAGSLVERIAELEAGIRYAIDLMWDGFVEEAIGELDRRLPGADSTKAKDQF